MSNTARTATEILRTATDGSTFALETIEYDHHEVHAGSSFVASGTADVANAGTVNAVIKAPAGSKYLHAVFEVTSESEVAFNFYEGFVAGSGGTVGAAVAVHNRNRNSATVATGLVYTGASVGTAGGTAGTLLYASHWGSGKGVGGAARSLSEWVLKADTQYLLEVVNATANANYTAWSFNWYEHTDKE